MGSGIVELDGGLGPARMFCDLAEDPEVVLLLGHGAGGGVDAPDLVALTALARERVAVLRFEQPWRTAGKRVAPAPARLDLGWRAALAYATGRWGGLPLVLGGRSAGARVACRAAAPERGGSTSPHEPADGLRRAEVSGVVALSFPLHPPRRPESSHAAELLAPTVPVLVLQGTKDPYGTPEEIADVMGGAVHSPRQPELRPFADLQIANLRLVAVPGCAHELKPAKRDPLDAEAVAHLLADSVRSFLTDVRAPSDAHCPPHPKG